MQYASAQICGPAPDGSGRGPLAVTRADYRFPAGVDPMVLGDRATEIWARMYRPVDFSTGPFPVVVFLHGNHGTCGIGASPRSDNNCQYTSSGTCPGGYVVTPNHLGYGYLAERLASWGYFVVSINANRGITCGGGVAGDGGLNLARGRLVLRHLQRLSQWNTFGGAPASLGLGPNDFIGTMDFSSVGLMGHSRGGEGARAAYNLYNDVGSPWPAQIPDSVLINAIFEIGPVDGQTARTLDADYAVWQVLLPACDGDVSNLQGIRPFDRMMGNFNDATQKSDHLVWGTNHNYYNTEWQQSDSGGCSGFGNPALFGPSNGSLLQRRAGRLSLLPFFRGNLGFGAIPSFNRNFNPSYTLPAWPTRVTRGFNEGTGFTSSFEEFDQATGINTFGSANLSSGLTGYSHGPIPEHVVRGAAISWAAPGAGTYFQTNWTDPGFGVDISSLAGFETLDFRVSRQTDMAAATDFSIRLVMDDGTVSGALSGPVQLSTYTTLLGPPSGHRILQTARIPLSAFRLADLTNIRGVRFTFDNTRSSAIYLANVRVSAITACQPGAGIEGSDDESQLPNPYSVTINEAMGRINNLRTVTAASALDNQSGVEIEVSSRQEFPVRNELTVLRIGGKDFKLSQYPLNGDTGTLIFTLTSQEFAQLSNGDPVTVQYGSDASNEFWNLGQLDKSLLDK